uniref:DUF2478 domain-containing protein n=2 Tax=Pannonibacter phragmitetus TaxID=121719 RepID=UPI000B969D64|nr:DUF2478 domain-containing protein [Pannonibacter phragmitetus]
MKEAVMDFPLAFILAEEAGSVDPVLLEASVRLKAAGVRLAGTVALPSAAEAGHPCETDLLVLPDGPQICISQKLGRHSRGCRLDPAALEEAVMQVQLSCAEEPAGAFLLNKFGRQEGEGRGFRDLIAGHLAAGRPVVTGINGLNLPAFEAFAEGLATRLPCEVEAVVEWVLAVAGETQLSPAVPEPA